MALQYTIHTVHPVLYIQHQLWKKYYLLKIMRGENPKTAQKCQAFLIKINLSPKLYLTNIKYLQLALRWEGPEGRTAGSRDKQTAQRT